jgi:hypothetical protein
MIGNWQHPFVQDRFAPKWIFSGPSIPAGTHHDLIGHA